MVKRAASQNASTPAHSSANSAARMAEYRLSPAAERDLERIWKYTLGEWGLEINDAALLACVGLVTTRQSFVDYLIPQKLRQRHTPVESRSRAACCENSR